MFVVAAVVVTFLFLMRQGYRWARTLLTGGGVASVVYAGTSLFSIDRSPTPAVLYAISAIVGSVLIAGACSCCTARTPTLLCSIAFVRLARPCQHLFLRPPAGHASSTRYFGCWLVASVSLVLLGLLMALTRANLPTFFRGAGILFALAGLALGYLAGRTRAGHAQLRRAAVGARARARCVACAVRVDDGWRSVADPFGPDDGGRGVDHATVRPKLVSRRGDAVTQSSEPADVSVLRAGRQLAVGAGRARVGHRDAADPAVRRAGDPVDSSDGSSSCWSPALSPSRSRRRGSTRRWS